MTWTTFGTTPNPTGQELDTNLAALSRMGIYPCSTGGSTNSIVLTLLDASAPPLTSYQNYQDFLFVAASTNTGNITIQVGALPPKLGFKDTLAGPAVMAGGEVVANCVYTATFEQRLNGNDGGFHLNSTAMVVNSPINPSNLQIGGVNGAGASLTFLQSATYNIPYTVIPANSTQEQTVSFTGSTPTDPILVGLPATVSSGLVFNARCIAGGTIALRAANVTAASIAAFTLAGVRLVDFRTIP